MQDFTLQAARLWQTILRSDQSDVFDGAPTSLIDRPHGHDRLPQPGFIGRNYQLGGLLILGQNPGNDAIGKGTSKADLTQYKLLHQLRDASDPLAFAAFQDLMATLGSSVMPTWPIIRNVVRPLLATLKKQLDDIAYTNMVKFRTVNSSFRGSVYDRSWPITSEQIDLLQPSMIIVLGKGNNGEFSRRYKGSIRSMFVHRAIGDTRLPDQGRLDIESIANKLAR